MMFMINILNKKNISLILIIIYASYYYFTRSCLFIIRDSLILEYGITLGEFGKISSAFALSYGLFQIVGGYLVDKYPLKYILPLSLFGTFIAQYIFLHANTPLHLYYSRYLLGCGFAIAVTSRLKYLSLVWPNHFVLLNGLISIFMGCTAAFASSGLFVEYLYYYGWKVIFSHIAFTALILGSLIFLSFDINYKNKEVQAKTVVTFSVFNGLKSICTNKIFIILAFYTIMISSTNYILLDGYGNNLLKNKLTNLAPSMYYLPTILNMCGGMCGAIYNIFAARLFSLSKQMFIHSFLNFMGLLGLVVGHSSLVWFIICFFLLGFSYMGQSIGFVWLKSNITQKYQGLGFGLLNFTGVFFGGAMVQRLAGMFLDVYIIKHNGAQAYLMLFKLLLIPSLLALILSFLFKKKSHIY